MGYSPFALSGITENLNLPASSTHKCMYFQLDHTTMRRPLHPSDFLILLLAGIGAVGAPHHGGKSANPSWLYSWARPRTVVVSQRPPAPGTTDALTPLKRAGTPVLRTWQRGAIHFRWMPDGIITQGFLDLNGSRSLPAWPTGEGACSRRVFAVLLSSPWVLHDAAGRIVIGLAGFLLGVIACACWQSSSTVPGPWSCRPGRGLRRRTCSSAHAKPPAIRWIDPGQSRPLPLTA